METFDLVVIGSGPGGYVASIRAAQKGLRVACVEKASSPGGTCLNVGCIPSKALLHSTEYFHRIAVQGEEHGIEALQLRADLDVMMKRKKKIVQGLTRGISLLFKKNQVVYLQGNAKLLSASKIQIGNQVIEAKAILLATGSEPIPLPFLPFDEKVVLSSTGALSLTKVPKKMVIIGAGVIGLELGSVYRRLGAEVEVVELLDRVTPTLDREVSQMVYQILKKQGFIFHLNKKVIAAQIQENGVALKLEGEEKELQGEVVLVAIGRRPYFKNLGLQELGVEQDREGRVVIDQSFRTSISNIYAIGDLVDGPMLAHKASEEGIAVIDIITGENTHVNYLAIPNVMYTWPEVACVGLQEEEAKASELEVLIGRISFKAIPRARCSGDEEGFVKIVAEKESGRIIGLHIVGPSASEMIHEGVIAIEKKATLRDIGKASHAHPTCSEAIKEAALAAYGQAIHL